MKHYCQKCGHPNEGYKIPKFCGDCGSPFAVFAAANPDKPRFTPTKIKPKKNFVINEEEDDEDDYEAYIPDIKGLDVEFEQDEIIKYSLKETIATSSEAPRPLAERTEVDDKRILEEFRREASSSKSLPDTDES